MSHARRSPRGAAPALDPAEAPLAEAFARRAAHAERAQAQVLRLTAALRKMTFAPTAASAGADDDADGDLTATRPVPNSTEIAGRSAAAPNKGSVSHGLPRRMIRYHDGDDDCCYENESFDDDDDEVDEGIGAPGVSLGPSAARERRLLARLAQHPTADPGNMAAHYAARAPRTPPEYSSSSLSRLMEGLACDADEVVLGSEQLLRYITDPQQRMWRVGALDGELARCRFHADCCSSWASTAAAQLPRYVTACEVVRQGASDEVVLTRRHLVELKEEADLADRELAHRRADGAAAAKRAEHLREAIDAKRFALCLDAGQQQPQPQQPRRQPCEDQDVGNQQQHQQQQQRRALARLRQLLIHTKNALFAMGMESDPVAAEAAEAAAAAAAGDAATADCDTLITALAPRHLAALLNRLPATQLRSVALVDTAVK